MACKIVEDKAQVFKNYIDGKVDDNDYVIVNIETDEVWDMCDLVVADIHDDGIIFIEK